jgi:hypothetical protein
MSNNYLVVQNIQVTWTKEMRSGLFATTRNQIPERLPLPFHKLPELEAGCIYHEVQFHQPPEYGELEEFIEIVPMAESYKFGIIEVVPQEEAVAVRFVATNGVDSTSNVIFEYEGMKTPRRTVPVQPLTIKHGQWGQIRYNGRTFINPHKLNKLFLKHIFNVGWFPDLNWKAFFDEKPYKTYSNLVDLW